MDGTVVTAIMIDGLTWWALRWMDVLYRALLKNMVAHLRIG